MKEEIKVIVKDQICNLIEMNWERQCKIYWYKVYINRDEIKIFKEWDLVWMHILETKQDKFDFIYYIIK